MDAFFHRNDLKSQAASDLCDQKALRDLADERSDWGMPACIAVTAFWTLLITEICTRPQYRQKSLKEI